MAAAPETLEPTLDRTCFEEIVARSSEAVLLLDAKAADKPIVYANPAFESLTGYRANDVIGKRWHVLARERGEHRGIDELQAAVERAEPAEVEFPDQRKDGTVWVARVDFSKIEDEQGEVQYFLVQQRESPRRIGRSLVGAALIRNEPTQLRHDIASFVGRADPVTGLPLFEQFEAVLNRDLAIAQRESRPVSLMLFQILDLDIYRATFGSKAAESCVRMIGAQLTSTLRRAGDLYARLDDTTLVAAVVGQDEAQAAQLAERIVANVHGLKLHNPRAPSGRYVTVESVVCGGVPSQDDDVDALLGRAQRLLAARLKPQTATYAAGPTESDAVLAGGS